MVFALSGLRQSSQVRIRLKARADDFRCGFFLPAFFAAEVAGNVPVCCVALARS
jgi:hypothetical protein